MKYVIVGGGNIGSVLAGELRRLHAKDEIVIVSSNVDKWSDKIDIYDHFDNLQYTAHGIKVIDSFVNDADVYFYTLPKQILSREVKKHIALVQNKLIYFVFLPGTGGLEFLLPKDKKNIVFVGLQRVPYIARIKEYGHSAYLLSKKDSIYYAVIGQGATIDIGKLLEIKAIKLKTFLEVTLTPSNPILHTTRLYSMFSEHSPKHVYDKNILFYEEWTDKASEWLIKCDKELQKILASISIDLSSVKPLLVHYESFDEQSLTKKIRSIEAFKGIGSPMREVEDGFVIDLQSRYFQEDFSYGLFIIKAIADVVNVATPNIDAVLRWYQNIVNEKLIDEQNHAVISSEYNLPQNVGIDNEQKLVDFYNKYKS